MQAICPLLFSTHYVQDETISLKYHRVVCVSACHGWVGSLVCDERDVVHYIRPTSRHLGQYFIIAEHELSELSARAVCGGRTDGPPESTIAHLYARKQKRE